MFVFSTCFNCKISNCYNTGDGAGRWRQPWHRRDAEISTRVAGETFTLPRICNFPTQRILRKWNAALWTKPPRSPVLRGHRKTRKWRNPKTALIIHISRGGLMHRLQPSALASIRAPPCLEKNTEIIRLLLILFSLSVLLAQTACVACLGTHHIGRTAQVI